MRKNKNGQIGAVVVFFVAIFVITLTVIIGQYVYTSVIDGLEAGDALTSAANDTVTVMNNNFAMFDYAIVGLTMLFCAGMVISSFFIPSHPVFYAINIMGIFVLVFVGMIITNTYAEIVSGEGAEYFGAIADNYDGTNFVIQYLPFIGAIMLILSCIVMYSRST